VNDKDDARLIQVEFDSVPLVVGERQTKIVKRDCQIDSISTINLTLSRAQRRE
jgi:hypothetical protein